MIGSMGRQNASLSLATLSPGASKTRDDKDKKDAFDTLADFMKKVAPEEVDSWQQQIDDSKRVLSQLQSSHSNINEQRKAAAQQKVDQLKARIQMLRMMAAVNPEAAAKLAKQLARELASAAKEYAAASGGGASTGGGVGGVSVPSIPSVPAGDATTATTTAVAGAAGGATSLTGALPAAAATGGVAAGEGTVPAGVGADTDNAGAGTSPSPEGQTGQPATTGEEPVATEAVAVSDTTAMQVEETATDQPGKPETPEERRERERKAVEGWAKETAASVAGAGYDGDNQFVTDVRWMKDMLNSIVQTAKRQIELEKNPDSKRDIKEAEGALQETEEALDAITGGVMAGIGAVNILV